MKHQYTILFEPTRVHTKRAIKELVSRFPPLTFDGAGESVESEHEYASRSLYKEAQAQGFTCSFLVETTYGYEDALRGDLGIIHLGPEGTDAFRAVLPKDAFDFSTGCPRCGVGAAEIKPRMISERSVGCSANFYHSTDGSSRILIRSEIGREIIAATGQPWCMRHPVTRAGKIVEEWMDPIPCATMPPLSPKSEGVLFGSSTACGSIGEPAEVVEPCPVCGRNVWADSFEFPTRLVYPRAAIEAAQKHAVVAMFEPKDCFPGLDPVRRTFKDLIGLPWLLFNRTSIKVLLKYMQTEHNIDSASIQPVFSE